MMNNPRVKTLKRLFALYGNQCAFPGCATPVADLTSDTLTGDVCHIKGRGVKGPRHDPHLTEEELHAFENLMLLCPTHHRVVDNDPAGYPVERLLAMKKEHERLHSGGREPGNGVASGLLQSAISDAARGDAPLRLEELRRPPDAIVELLKDHEAGRRLKLAKWYGAAALINLLCFFFYTWFMSLPGVKTASILDALPTPAFLPLAAAFGQLARVELRLRGRLKEQSPFGGKVRHLVRELALGAAYEEAAQRCVKELRATGALMYEIMKSEQAGEVVIHALKEHGRRWTRFTARGFLFDELEIRLSREDDGRCRFVIETSLGDNPGRSIEYAANVVKRIVGWDKAPALKAAPKPGAASARRVPPKNALQR